MMDIYSKIGSKVTVTENSAKNGYDPDKALVKKNLNIGETYTIKAIYVDRFYTDVILEEFPNIKFNSVNFENL